MAPVNLEKIRQKLKTKLKNSQEDVLLQSYVRIFLISKNLS
jgi:hypothetical protein